MNEGSLKLPSEQAANTVNPLLQAHARLREAERFRQAKALDKAQGICAHLLKEHPDYVGALQTLGLIQADRHEFEAARLSLSRAAMLNPRDWKILTALAGVYLKLNANEMAMRTLEQAQALKPEESSILATLAAIYREEREYELAAAAYAKAHALDPSLRLARIGLSWSLNHLGRFQEMAQVLSAVIREDPEDLAALSALCQLPAKFIDIDMIESLDRVRKKQGQLRDQADISLGFVRASALDRAGRHDEAWRELVSVNDRAFSTLAGQLARDERAGAKHLEMVKTLKQIQAQSRKEAPCQSLFILGPSRSGKTTMERLVADLPGVKRGYENPMVENAIRRSFQEAGLVTRRRLFELPPSLDELFYQCYLYELVERAKGARVFTNTHPGRISDAWRLAVAIPGVRFVFVKRDPHDLALRIYMKHYQGGHAYSYDLRATFRYIAWYHAMMDGIAAQFPAIVRIIAYEDMIADPRRALATVAELCGLTVPDIALPELGDDRGAAVPYREAMEKALNAG